MTVETATIVSELNASLPAAGDDLGEGDDHIRLIKTCVKATIAQMTGLWTYVSTQTASASASITFGSFAAGYDYQVVAHGVYFSAANTLSGQVTVAATPVSGGSSYYYMLNGAISSGTAEDVAATGSSFPIVSSNSAGNANSETTAFEWRIINPNEAVTSPKHMFLEASWMLDGAGNGSARRGAIQCLTASAVDGVVFTPGSGTITAGTFRLYKRAHS